MNSWITWSIIICLEAVAIWGLIYLYNGLDRLENRLFFSIPEWTDKLQHTRKNMATLGNRLDRLELDVDTKLKPKGLKQKFLWWIAQQYL